MIREATYSTIRIGAYEPIKVHVFGATDRHHTPLLKKIGSGATSGRIETVHVNTTQVQKEHEQKCTNSDKKIGTAREARRSRRRQGRCVCKRSRKDTKR